MGGSPIGGGGGGGKSAPKAPAPQPAPAKAGDDGEKQRRIQAAKRREAERLKRQAGITAATGEDGVLGAARVGRNTLG